MESFPNRTGLSLCLLTPINHFQVWWLLSGGCGSRVDISKAAELLQSQQNYLVEWKRETQSCSPMWERLRSCARALLVSSKGAAKGDAQPDCSSFAHSQCLCKQLIIHGQDTEPWHCGLPGQGEITHSQKNTDFGWLQAAPEVV